MDPDDWAIPPIVPPAQTMARGKAEQAITPPHGAPAGNDDLCSLNEVDALVRKAGRGAGLSWGQAEETGKCARVLASAGQAGLTLVADVLEAQRHGALSGHVVTEGKTWKSADGLPINPLVLGPSLADRIALLTSEGMNIEGPIAAPALLVPFLGAAASRQGSAVRIGTDLGECMISAASDATAVPPALAGPVRWLRLSPAAATGHGDPRPAPVRPVRLPAALKARLEVLAALTYVASSELSRATGAGAGLNDND
jgi:hypothetical protein